MVGTSVSIRSFVIMVIVGFVIWSSYLCMGDFFLIWLFWYVHFGLGSMMSFLIDVV